MSIAKTVIEQFGGNGFCAMVGAYRLIDEGNGVSFKFKGSRKANYCKVILTPLDEYNVEFGKVVGLSYQVVANLEGVCCDQLAEIFRSVTGLETRMPQIINLQGGDPQ